MITKPIKNAIRVKRHKRMRNYISGTPERPRLCVFRSNKYIYAQLIDDKAGHTLAAASTMESEIASKLEHTDTIEAAQAVGEAIAKKALAAGITSCVFDRGGYVFQGKIKALADAAREAGLQF